MSKLYYYSTGNEPIDDENFETHYTLSHSVLMEYILQSTRESFYRLSVLPIAARNDLLSAMKAALVAHREDILAANLSDLEEARDSVTPATFKRLQLNAEKITGLISGLDAVIALADPLGRTAYAQEMTAGLSLYRVSCPIGVVACIFEARPDAAVQIASLAIKSGNAVVLKGGREARRTNRALVTALRSALPPQLEAAITLIDTREHVAELLKHEKFVDLVIPRGSAELVRFIKANTRIPVLGHADGICSVFVHAAADLVKALAVVVDAKTQYPAVCNATETLLVDAAVAEAFLPQAVEALLAKGVELRLAESAVKYLSSAQAGRVTLASEADFFTEFCELVLAVKVVDDLEAAVEHINGHGSHHTDAIITEDPHAAEKFMNAIDSAGVYWNASTRFADGFRYGFGAEVGVSTGKFHARGPMGLEGLTTYKFKLFGDGHTVAVHGAILNPGHVTPQIPTCPF